MKQALTNMLKQIKSIEICDCHGSRIKIGKIYTSLLTILNVVIESTTTNPIHSLQHAFNAGIPFHAHTVDLRILRLLE